MKGIISRIRAGKNDGTPAGSSPNTRARGVTSHQTTNGAGGGGGAGGGNQPGTPALSRSISGLTSNAGFTPTTTPTTKLSINPAIPNPSNKGEDIFISNITPSGNGPVGKPEPQSVSTAIPSRFAVGLEIPGGTRVVLRCDATVTVAEFKRIALAKVKSLLTVKQTQVLALYTVDHQLLAPESLLTDNIYIEQCLIKKEQPQLLLLPVSNGPGSQPESPSSPSRVYLASVSISGPVPLSPRSPRVNPYGGRAPSPDLQGSRALQNELKSALGNNKESSYLFEVQFLLPGGKTAVISCAGTSALKDIKEQLSESHPFLTPLLADYTLTAVTSQTQFLSDESCTLDSLEYITQCRKGGTIPKMILVEKSRCLTEKEKRENLEIGALVGQPLCWTNQEDEIAAFRRSMAKVRAKVAKSKEGEKSEMEGGGLAVRLCDTPINSPVGLPPLYVRIHMRKDAAKVVQVLDGGMEKADAFLERMLKMPAFVKEYKTDGDQKYVLKAQGMAEYIVGDVPMINFAYVRDSAMKKERPKFVMVDRSAITATRPPSSTLVQSGPSKIQEKTFELRYSHQKIARNDKPWDRRTCISIWELGRAFQLKLIGAERVNENSKSFMLASNNTPMYSAGVQMFVSCGVYYGGTPLVPLMFSKGIAPSANPRWYQTIKFQDLACCNIPRAARLCFTLYARPMKNDEILTWEEEVTEVTDKDVPLGWVNITIFDYKHEMRTGTQSLGLWPDGAANPIGTCVQNLTSPNVPLLMFEMEKYTLPVVFPTEPLPPESWPTRADLGEDVQQEKYINQLESVINKDPLYILNDLEKQMVWGLRALCLSKPQALSKFLQATTYTDFYGVQEMHSLLPQWTPPLPIDALELLDSKFADPVVRAYAVHCLEPLGEDEFMDYLLQLVQVLKYEPYHNSALARFLLTRALRNRHVGHAFFWYLRSEMDVPEISERYGLLIEQYLRGCGSHLVSLKKQTNILKDLTQVAYRIKEIEDKNERDLEMLKQLNNIQVPEDLQLPLNPSMEARGLVLERCKIMDSKKLPLWLVWKNADPAGDPIFTIFKAGDDLRQDMLTLQMLRIMDKLWKREGLDLGLAPYGCIATGDSVGFIEVVLNSATTAAITKESGGGAKAAFKESPLHDWLKKHNASKHNWELAIDNFVRSCAGYCVATYVLGIGDRHNDNVMVTRDGRLFHIDFGHFLGNYKKKWGIKRERAPFVLTPDFVFVMGGRESEGFKRFIKICCQAYNILRKHASMFINLFAMMLSTGIPELKSAKDIKYLRKAFAIDKTDEAAAQYFTMLITMALDCWTTRFNNAIHIIAH